MSTSTHYAALVIGSGQGGTPLATAFAKAGHKTALVEATHVGGCCINEGCTPTKTMIASGRVAYLTRRAADFGVHARDIKVDMEKVRQRKRDIVESFRSGSERRLKDGGVTLIRGTASLVDDKTVRVRGIDGDKTISADRIVINTGARPVVPRLEGLDTATFPEGTVLDSTTIQELGVVPNHLVVIGGGYIGVEFGQLFRRLGARVTILQRNSQLLPREDSDVAAALFKILKEDGITVHFNATPTRITTSAAPHSMHPVTLTVKFHDGAEIELQSSHVLFAAGRTPNTDTLNPGAAGVSLGPGGYVKVDEQLRTTRAVPHSPTCRTTTSASSNAT
jgi:pyruvate/2-oxoglutarate dehydrogenase complex dihydrolipoamide dehydrogenase (E3) component